MFISTIPISTIRSVDIYFFLPTQLSRNECGFIPICQLCRLGGRCSSGICLEQIDTCRKHLIIRIYISGHHIGLLSLRFTQVAYPTGCSRYRKVSESLIVTQQIVGINFIGRLDVFPIISIVIHIGRKECRCITTAVFLIFGVIDADSRLETQSVINIGTTGYRTIETVFVYLIAILVHQPIRIILSGFHIRPVLHRTWKRYTSRGQYILPLIKYINWSYITVPCAVYGIIIAIVTDIDIARHHVHVINRVSGRTATGTITGNGLYIIHRHVEMESLKEFITLTECKRVAIVRVAFDHSFRVRITEREISLNLIRTTGQCYRVIGRKTGTIKIIKVIARTVTQIDLMCTIRAELVSVQWDIDHQIICTAWWNFVAPTVYGKPNIRYLCSINILNFRCQKRRIESKIWREIDG